MHHLGAKREITGSARGIDGAGGCDLSPNAVRSGGTDQSAGTPAGNTVVRVSALVLKPMFSYLRAQADHGRQAGAGFLARQQPVAAA
jgi:hypothetical protein